MTFSKVNVISFGYELFRVNSSVAFCAELIYYDQDPVHIKSGRDRYGRILSKKCIAKIFSRRFCRKWYLSFIPPRNCSWKLKNNYRLHFKGNCKVFSKVGNDINHEVYCRNICNKSCILLRHHLFFSIWSFAFNNSPHCLIMQALHCGDARPMILGQVEFSSQSLMHEIRRNGRNGSLGVWFGRP